VLACKGGDAATGPLHLDGQHSYDFLTGLDGTAAGIPVGLEASFPWRRLVWQNRLLGLARAVRSGWYSWPSLKTVVDLINNNCMWCQEAMMARLRACPLVRGVHVSTSTGCWSSNMIMTARRHSWRRSVTTCTGGSWLVTERGSWSISTYTNKNSVPLSVASRIQDERGKHGAPSFQRGDVWPPHCAAMSESLSRSDPVGRLGSAAESEHSP
jgi:hypothetical protein